MSSRISFNVNAQRLGDSAYFMQVMRALRPASVTIMHGFELAQQLTDETGTVAFFRTDVDKDPDLLALTPAEYVAHYKAQRNGTARVHGYVLNEPVQTARFSWKAITDWLVEVGYRLAEAKLPAVIGNIGPGTFEKADVENGTFDRLLKMLNDTAEIGHSLGVHEYTGILLPFGVGQWPREALLDKNAVQPAAWPTAAQLPRARWNGTLPPYWHLRRSDWLQIRAQEIGLKPVTTDMTEFGWDRLPDLTVGGQLNPYDVLQSRYGLVAPHRTYRGVASLRKVFEDYFPQWTFEQSVFEQLKWADQIYPSDVRALHVFTWSENAPDWDIEFGCNISRFKALHTLLVDYANSKPEQPQPEPEPDMKAYIVTKAGAISTINVYADQTSHNVQPIGSIPSGARVLADLEASPPMNDWVRVEYNGVTGWAPRQRGVVTWTLADSEPPTLPATDDPRWRLRLGVSTGSSTNVRGEPSLVGRLVAKVSAGGITLHAIPEHLLTEAEKAHATRSDGFWHVIKVPLTDGRSAVGYARDDALKLYEVGVGTYTALERWKATTQRTIERLSELRLTVENEIALQRMIEADIDEQIDQVEGEPSHES